MSKSKVKGLHGNRTEINTVNMVQENPLEKKSLSIIETSWHQTKTRAKIYSMLDALRYILYIKSPYVST